VKATVRLAGA